MNKKNILRINNNTVGKRLVSSSKNESKSYEDRQMFKPKPKLSMKLHLIVRKSLGPVELYNDAMEKSKIQYNKVGKSNAIC
ncbi:hypothetical protein T08_3832 [Trichinella sp. T8]|nr:hypothetical protein T08_3832 [Trichinella sp. T8]